MKSEGNNTGCAVILAKLFMWACLFVFLMMMWELNIPARTMDRVMLAAMSADEQVKLC